MHRHAIVGFICLAAIPLCVLAWVQHQGARARAHLVAANGTHWPGYEVVVSRSWESGGEVHTVRVEQRGEQVFEGRFAVGVGLTGGEPKGFVAALNADRDPDLEIVHCDSGVIQSYVEPGWRNIGVVQHHGIDASPTARDVCAAYFESVDWTVNVFCVLMGSLGIVFLLFRHRDDDQEKHSVPKPF